jgi:hypothetical protein
MVVDTGKIGFCHVFEAVTNMNAFKELLEAVKADRFFRRDKVSFLLWRGPG